MNNQYINSRQLSEKTQDQNIHNQ